MFHIGCAPRAFNLKKKIEMKFAKLKSAIKSLRDIGVIEPRETHFTIMYTSQTGTLFVEYIFIHAYIITFGNTVVCEVISPRESADMLAHIEDDQARYIYDACLNNF